MYMANSNGKRKLIAVLSHKIVVDFALTDYWHDNRAYVTGRLGLVVLGKVISVFRPFS